jgi:hypothetical protein
LGVLVDGFLAQIRAKKVIGTSDIAAIFQVRSRVMPWCDLDCWYAHAQNVETILSFHRVFLVDLEKRIATWNRHSLMGDLFVR